MIDLDRLKRFVTPNQGVDPATLQECLDEAKETVEFYCRKWEILETVPTSKFDRGVLLCAQDLYAQQKSPQGVVPQISTFGEGSVTTGMRVSSDPLLRVRPLFAEYIGPSFA